MANERGVLCGSASDRPLPADDPRPLHLRMWEPHRNVRLTIEDVRREMVGEVPPEFLDLLDIATYVYCADQAVTRGGSGAEDAGENWRRRLFFRVPVRKPDLWRRGEVLEQLVATLSFLSDDEYHFDFEPLAHEPPLQRYLDFRTTPFTGVVEEVVMFSGGLDSLGGAVQESVIDKRAALLVNHRSTQKLASRHRRLLSLLGERAGDTAPQHIAVRVNKKKRVNREFTQRTRSFLYVSLGATVAVMVGLSRVRFYENGVVSLNLPPLAQVVGARATRTTHPRVLDGYAKLLTCLAGKPFAVENPFLWHTKKDVVKLIADAGCGDLIRYTTSCTHTWEMTKRHTHCGGCSQCIDRRFAVLAAGQAAKDPAEAYGVDLLTGERPEGESRTMLAAFLETANEIEGMKPPEFFGRFGEASRVLRHLPGSPDSVAAQVYELYRRHATQVNHVVDQGLAGHAAAIRRRELPPSCLLRLVADTGPLADGVTAWPGAKPNEQPPPLLADNIFRRKGELWEVRFAGGETNLLYPSKGAAYLHILLSSPNTFLTAADLAWRVSRNRERYALGDAGEVADREALSAYRARADELVEELQEARENNDPGAQERIRQEMQFLAEQTRAARGLGGRQRKASDDRERVRKAVANAIRRTIQTIAQYDRQLAEHLRGPRLRVGRSLSYTPDRGLRWET
jgi:hypothetical protein